MLAKTKNQNSLASLFTKKRLRLQDGKDCTLYLARYPRQTTRLELVAFKTPQRLVEWCASQDVAHAVSGGFFLRRQQKMLGEMWIGGRQQATVPVAAPWAAVRAALWVDATCQDLQIARRDELPHRPKGDMLQAGPLLVQNGRNLMLSSEDQEGFTSAAYQFDSDITIGRYPRAAIAMNEQFIWTVACDGRSRDEAGLTLSELADALIMVGADTALNLDGGSSASLIYNGRLINTPRSPSYRYPKGRRIYSALVLHTI